MKPCGPLTVERLLKNYRTNELFKTKGLSYRGCIADLDNQIVEDGVVLEDCLIRYSGKSLKFGTIRFVNCLFDLNVDRTAPPAGMLLAKSLLSASNIEDVLVKKTG